MAVTTTVRMGGASGATTVDYTSQVPTFQPDGSPNLTAAQGFINGQQFEFTVIDDLGEIPRANLTKNLPAHTVVTVTESGYWLARGRISRKGWGRGDRPVGNSRTARVVADCQTQELKGLVTQAAWVRPAESGRARILALITAFLSGSPRVTTSVQNHKVAAGGEVTMPAKTYPAGTDLPDIVRDCAEMEGKDATIVIHHDGGSHLCFFFADEEDWTIYPSPAAISDVIAEANPDHATAPVYFPMWEQGDASVEEGQDRPISHLVNKYGSGDSSFVTAANSSRVTSYDYWAIAHNDPDSETAAQAQARADALVGATGREHVTHQVTIQCRASQVQFFCAGMSINIKSAAAMGGLYLGTVQTRRIASVKFEPIAPDVGVVPGFYLVHMQLDRPLKQLRTGPGAPVGPKAPASGTSTTTLYNLDFELVAPDDYRETVAIYPSGTGLWPEGQANTSAATGGGDNPGDATGNGTGYAFFGSSFGTADSPLLPATPGTVYRWACYARANASPQTDVLTVKFYDAADTVLSTNTLASITSTNVWEQYTGDFTAPTGSAYQKMVGQVAPLTAAFYDKVVVSIPGTAADTTEPVGGTGTGSTGTNTDTFAPIDHSHDHDHITTGGPYHMAEDVTFAPTGTIAATTVQAGMAEIATDYAAADAAHTAAADPHTGYVREADANWVDLTDGGSTTLHSHASSGIPTGYYRPLMDGLGNVVTDSGTGAAIMAYAED